MKIALVTGATGKIGQILVPELLRQNFKVRVFLRGDIRDRTQYLEFKILTISPSIEIFYGDIRDYKSVEIAVSGVDYVFHLAALLNINNPHPSMYGKYYDVNVIGTKNIVDAALKASIQRVIIFSTISVYGVTYQNYSDSYSQIFCETSPVNPLTIYAKTKLLSEQYLKSCVTVLRLASVYGSLVTGNYLMLIQAVKKGFFCLPVNEKGLSVYRTLIHENDVVSGAILAATHPDAAGKIYNLTDGDIHSLKDIVKAVADALSIKVKIIKVPHKPLQIISNFMFRYSKYENIDKLTFIISKLMENITVCGQKIERELGFKPHYSLKNGWSYSLNNNLYEK